MLIAFPDDFMAMTEAFPLSYCFIFSDTTISPIYPKNMIFPSSSVDIPMKSPCSLENCLVTWNQPVGRSLCLDVQVDLSQVCLLNDFTLCFTSRAPRGWGFTKNPWISISYVYISIQYLIMYIYTCIYIMMMCNIFPDLREYHVDYVKCR